MNDNAINKSVKTKSLLKKAIVLGFAMFLFMPSTNDDSSSASIYLTQTVFESEQNQTEINDSSVQFTINVDLGEYANKIVNYTLSVLLD